MSKLSSIAVVVGSVALVWIGCSSDPGGTGSSSGAGGNSGSSGSGVPIAMPIFETDIVPIFNKSCGAGNNSCHSEVAYAADQTNACRGWLALKDAPLGSQIYGGPDNGKPTGCPDLPLYERLTQLDAWQECNGALKKYIAPCNVDGSYLFDKIDDGPYCGVPASLPMPKDAKMDPAEKETIRNWILNGAPRKDGSGVKCGGADAGTGQPPQAKINHPGDMETRPANMPIPFIGVATDPEDGTLTGASLVWTSDKSGQFGTGENFSAPLPVGTHIVTLTVTDSDKNTAKASITLYIQ